MRTIRILLTIFLLAPLPAFAQTVHIPDPGLRAEISRELDGAPITRETMLQLTELYARDRGITDLTGLEYAHNVKWLTLVYSNITDLAPISDLRLEGLQLWDNQVSDLSPIAGMRSLIRLDLAYNQVSDISALANLTNLKLLELQHNRITDITPLAGLTSLEELWITNNRITDHSSLDGLSLEVFEYDQNCDMPPLPLQQRLDNQNYPSLFSPFGMVPNKNKPHVQDLDLMARYNLVFCCVTMFTHHLDLFEADDGWQVYGSLDEAIQGRDHYISRNPNMIFLAAFSWRFVDLSTYPPDSPYWLRDAGGEIAMDYGKGMVDFTHPDVQQEIIQKVVAIDTCGLYDGVFFDFWGEHPPASPNQAAMLSILKGIRANVRENFLIMGNTNRDKAPTWAPYMNGSFFESGLPIDDFTNGDDFMGGGDDAVSRGFSHMEETLLWAEENYRSPQINSFLGFGFGAEPMGSPTNRRYMRAITTLNLTFSDSYVMYYLSGPDGGTDTGLFSGFYWYDFWDADLGRPLGEKSQLYEGRPGLYIREYTNGWAVYNHSGEAQVVTLPEEVRSVTSGLSNTKHAVLNLDGDILLNIPPLLPGDINGDGIVNILDLTLVAQGFGTGDLTADVNGDGVVNVFDLVFVAGQF